MGERLTDEELEHVASESSHVWGLVVAMVTELRDRRSADLSAEEVAELRQWRQRTGERGYGSEFLPVLSAIDKVLAARGTKTEDK